jgi:hypothetical protein
VNQYARKIIEEVKSGEGYATTYRLACDMLGVRDSVEVAILVARLPLNWKLSRLYGLLGLTPNYAHTSQNSQQAFISIINDMELVQIFLRIWRICRPRRRSTSCN